MEKKEKRIIAILILLLLVAMVYGSSLTYELYSLREACDLPKLIVW